ncbi:AAA family ATPase, partial [Synechococcus sp.]
LASYINRVEIAAKILETKQQTGDGGFKALTAADRIAMKKPVIHWLLPGLLPANDLTILGGRPKVGKTRLAVAMAAAVLKGEALFDLPTPAKAAPVVLVTDDQSDGDTASMLEAVELWDHPNLIWSRNFRISETDLDALLETIKANPGALVIIDSLRSISRSMQKGENDPEIGAVLYDLKQAVMDAGGTLLLIHHCNKAADLVGVEALSGHNAIAGAANTVLTMHYLQGENNQPNKSIPERQLFREARSGDGLDLVITRDGNSFRSLGSMDAHKEQAQEQKQLSKLSNLQHQVLDVVAGDWMTRRQVCDELEIEWSDSGRNKEARQVKRALDRLAETKKIESIREGGESTYRNPSRMGTKKEVTLVTVVTPSHTNGLEVTTFETVSGNPGTSQSYQVFTTPPASIDLTVENCDLANELPGLPGLPQLPLETVQPKSLLSLGGTTVTTVPTAFNSNEKKSDKRVEAERRIHACGQTTIHLGGVTDDEMVGFADTAEAAFARSVGRGAA